MLDANYIVMTATTLNQKVEVRNFERHTPRRCWQGREAAHVTISCILLRSVGKEGSERASERGFDFFPERLSSSSSAASIPSQTLCSRSSDQDFFNQVDER